MWNRGTTNFMSFSPRSLVLFLFVSSSAPAGDPNQEVEGARAESYSALLAGQALLRRKEVPHDPRHAPYRERRASYIPPSPVTPCVEYLRLCPDDAPSFVVASDHRRG